MFAILATKSLQTSVLAGLLFYVFANPGMYKMIRKFPGLKFVMKGATEITHAGTVVNAVLFGLVMLLCVQLINSALIKDHLKFLNVVEGYTPQGTSWLDDLSIDLHSEFEGKYPNCEFGTPPPGAIDCTFDGDAIYPAGSALAPQAGCAGAAC
jgi:hypothetical protein